MLRLSAVAGVTLLGFVCGAHAACEGQTGKAIFEDSFTDDSGGWDLSSYKVVPPVMVADLTEEYTANSSLNATFYATEGDYCAEVKLPASPTKGNPISGGLLFLASDYSNYFLANITSEGSVGLYKRSAGRWSTIYTASDTRVVKMESNAVNTIRVTVKDGKIIFYVNGTQLKTVRAQISNDPLRFGMFAQTDKAIQSSLEVDFTSYSVTTGQ